MGVGAQFSRRGPVCPPLKPPLVQLDTDINITVENLAFDPFWHIGA